MKKLFVLSLMVFTFLGVQAQNVKGKGFFEVNYSFLGSNERADNQLLVTASYGVSFCDGHLFTGGGIGFGISTEEDIYPCNIPIFADIRCSFTNGNVKPFIAGKVGYGLLSIVPLIGDCGYSGGLFASPSIGIAISAFNHNDIIINVGYTYHSACFHWIDSSGPIITDRSEKYNAGGFKVSLGLSF